MATCGWVVVGRFTACWSPRSRVCSHWDVCTAKTPHCHCVISQRAVGNRMRAPWNNCFRTLGIATGPFEVLAPLLTADRVESKALFLAPFSSQATTYTPFRLSDTSNSFAHSKLTVNVSETVLSIHLDEIVMYVPGPILSLILLCDLCTVSVTSPPPHNPTTPHHWPDKTSRWCCLLWYLCVFYGLNILALLISLIPPSMVDASPRFKSKCSIIAAFSELPFLCCSKITGDEVDEAILDDWDVQDYKQHTFLWSLWLSTRTLSAVIKSDFHGQIPVKSPNETTLIGS